MVFWSIWVEISQSLVVNFVAFRREVELQSFYSAILIPSSLLLGFWRDIIESVDLFGWYGTHFNNIKSSVNLSMNRDIFLLVCIFNKHQQRYGKVGTRVYCCSECKWCSCYGNGMAVPQEIKNQIAMRSSYLVSCIYPKELISGIARDTRTLMFIAALFTVAKMWKLSKCLWTDAWSRKIHTME